MSEECELYPSSQTLHKGVCRCARGSDALAQQVAQASNVSYKGDKRKGRRHDRVGVVDSKVGDNGRLWHALPTLLATFLVGCVIERIGTVEVACFCRFLCQLSHQKCIDNTEGACKALLPCTAPCFSVPCAPQTVSSFLIVYQGAGWCPRPAPHVLHLICCTYALTIMPVCLLASGCLSNHANLPACHFETLWPSCCRCLTTMKGVSAT
eukprot:1145102-Pelagomonas_calceolata.AAC.2